MRVISINLSVYIKIIDVNLWQPQKMGLITVKYSEDSSAAE